MTHRFPQGARKADVERRYYLSLAHLTRAIHERESALELLRWVHRLRPGTPAAPSDDKLIQAFYAALDEALGAPPRYQRRRRYLKVTAA